MTKSTEEGLYRGKMYGREEVRMHGCVSWTCVETTLRLVAVMRCICGFVRLSPGESIWKLN